MISENGDSFGLTSILDRRKFLLVGLIGLCCLRGLCFNC